MTLEEFFKKLSYSRVTAATYLKTFEIVDEKKFQAEQLGNRDCATWKKAECICIKDPITNKDELLSACKQLSGKRSDWGKQKIFIKKNKEESDDTYQIYAFDGTLEKEGALESLLPSYNQKIFFGAPGTGKSHKIKDTIGAGKTFRTTFHPDTDYASFVGCYKPRKEGEHITYSFVPQVFTKAYLAAWNAYLSAEDKSAESVYLVIEEINRGNCAQIFGDIFQLLDRENGFSEYPIDVDSDLAEYIKSNIAEWDKYCEKIEELEEQSSQKDGEIFSKIALPANLFILATMNTSDQSLFPMDSAFKRRFDWEYVPICFEGKPAAAYEIETVTKPDGNKKTWQPFVEQVNEKIKKCLASEDKQIGEFFVKADSSDTITENQFISKVLFYLWQEVFKDEPDNENNIFRGKDENGQAKTFTFQDLFNGNKDKALKVILGNAGLTWSPTKSNS